MRGSRPVRASPWSASRAPPGTAWTTASCSAQDEWFIRLLRNGLDRFGIPVESSKTEWGLGQQEITIDHAPALQMADYHVLFKHSVKQLAAAAGMTASFMAKPGIDEVGSSCHIHASLWSAATGEPLDWEPSAPARLSERFGQFVAGQIACARELGLLWAPTVNSYKRYVPNAFAGTALVAGLDNRSCGFRLVGEDPAFRIGRRHKVRRAPDTVRQLGSLGVTVGSAARQDPSFVHSTAVTERAGFG